MRPFPRIRRPSRRALGLHRCAACGSPFVCPIEWEADGPDHWLIQLHCGGCDVWRDVRATNAEAKAFDLELDRGLAQIERALAEIDQARMREQVDAFTAALARDLIDPADFASP